MKTTLDIPDELMRGMKIRAATQGRKLKDVVADALRESLAPSASGNSNPAVISHTQNGFPYIKGKTPRGSSASEPDELQRLIQESQLEEDLHRAGLLD